MAAGKSSRFNSGDRQQKGQPNHRPLSKEFTPLDIPSNRCILEIILARLSALAEKCQCSLTVYLSLNPTQVESL
jgi:UDP-N-acetylglucosamine pyrophosphorylase